MLNSPNKIINNNVTDEELYLKRIRIPVKIVFRNEDIALKVVKYMLILRGVVHCTANPITGKVLVIFNDSLVTEYAIEKYLEIFISKSTPYKQMIIKLNNQRNDIEAALPIAIGKINSIIDIDETNLWHHKNCSEVEIAFSTNLNLGLTLHSISDRTSQYGLNILSQKKKKSLLSRFIENLGDFSTKLLLGVSVASFLIGQIPDAIVILSIVILENSLSTIQQSKAENSIYSLKDMMVHNAKVIRAGQEQEIDAKLLVPGDVIMLEAGEKVPADARIIECCNLNTS